MIMGPNQTEWVEALESGKYLQGLIMLNADGRFCCLGVACEIMEISKEGSKYGSVFRYGGLSSNPPLSLIEKLKLNRDEISRLMIMNDIGRSFKEIAQYIRANPSKVFEESV